MSHVRNESTAETIRMRLQLLRTYHQAAVRSGEECLRAAMAEYQQSFGLGQEREPA